MLEEHTNKHNFLDINLKEKKNNIIMDLFCKGYNFG